MKHFAHLAIMGEAEWLRPADLRVFQELRLAELVDYALRWSPFYRRRLARVLRPDGSLDWSEWHATPLLTRECALEREIDMHSLRVPADHGAIDYVASPGRTADPLAVAWPRFAFVIQDCLRGRMYRWHDIDPRLKLLSLNAQIDGAERETSPHWNGAMRELGIEGEHVRVSSSIESPVLLEKIIAERPEVLEMPVGRLREILALAQGEYGALPGVDAIVTWGETVEPALRSLCSEIFGARLVETYRLAETGTVAIACPTGSGYHAQSDTCLVEVLDDEGRPCPFHEEGQIAVTPFFNLAMPLIRYQTGDRAMRLPPCQCGRALPLMSNIRAEALGANSADAAARRAPATIEGAHLAG